VRPERRAKLSSRQLYAARVATILLAGSTSSVFQALIGQARGLVCGAASFPF